MLNVNDISYRLSHKNVRKVYEENYKREYGEKLVRNKGEYIEKICKSTFISQETMKKYINLKDTSTPRDFETVKNLANALKIKDPIELLEPVNEKDLVLIKLSKFNESGQLFCLKLIILSIVMIDILSFFGIKTLNDYKLSECSTLFIIILTFLFLELLCIVILILLNLQKRSFHNDQVCKTN